jgi:hypothetical protein
LFKTKFIGRESKALQLEPPDGFWDGGYLLCSERAAKRGKRTGAEKILQRNPLGLLGKLPLLPCVGPRGPDRQDDFF